MTRTMTPSYKRALLQADDVRIELGFNMFQPINIYDACARLGLTVRFVDLSMEGMYARQQDGKNPTILLSNQRPLPRRNFTCAHELGHHVFGHGSKLDPLSERVGEPTTFDPDEMLVDCFSGALLMPGAGIEAAFAKRKLTGSNASPIDIYTICSDFGVGYQTLVNHCRAMRMIPESSALSLLRATPKKIFTSFFGTGSDNSHFKVMDKHSRSSVIDLEVSNFIILPANVEVEGDHIRQYQQTVLGIAYVAIKPGIVRASRVNGSWSAFVRVQNFQYVGLAENRHLETSND